MAYGSGMKAWLNLRLVMALALLALSGAPAQSAAYTWNGSVSGDWGNALNWTPAGVPGATDAVTIESAPNVPLLSSPVSLAGLTLVSGTLNLGGHTLTVTGPGTYSGGTVTNGSLVLSAPADAHVFSGAVIGAVLSGTASSIVFAGSVFQQTVQLTRTGSATDLCYGANVFQQPVSLTQAGTGTWSITNLGATQFQGGVQVASTANGIVQFGAGGGATSIPAGQTIAVGPSGFSIGQLQLRNLVQSGATPQALVLTGTALLSLQAGCVFNGSLTVSAPRILLSGGTYHGAATFTKTGTGTDNGSGGCTFNGPVSLTVTSSGFLLPASIGADVYNAGLTVSCTGTGGIQFGAISGTTTIAAGQSIGIGGAGFGSGLLQLTRINQLGGAAQVLNLGASAMLRFVGPNTFNGPVTASAGSLIVGGSTFHAACSLTKTGAGTDVSPGGNVFNGTATIGSSGSGEFQLHATGTDQFNSNLLFQSTGTGVIRFGALTGTSTLAAGASLGTAPGGFSSGALVLRGFTQSGGTAQALAFTGTASLTIGTGCVFQAPLDVTAPALFFNGGVFQATLRGTKTGATVDACTGGNTFQELAEFAVTGSGALWLNDTGTDSFLGDIRVNSVGSGGVHFGMSGGSATLAAGRTIAVGPLGFDAGMLTFRNFQQLGGTPQSIHLTGTAGIRYDLGSVFTGDITCSSPALMLDGATFHGDVDAIRSGAAVNVCRGGNVFHGSFRLRMSGSAPYFMATLLPDEFKGPAWFQRLGAGALHVAYTHDARFAGDLSTMGTAGAITFGANGGWVEVSGSGSRDWQSNVAFPFAIPRLRVNGAGSVARFAADVVVSQAIAFTQGVLQPMAGTSSGFGLLVLQASCTVTDPADDGSYADGWVRRIGASAFTFPLGNGGAHAPLAISAPAGPSEHFTARYRRNDPHPLWNVFLKDLTLDHLSRCEYWELERTGGSSAVVVTLSWDTPRSCTIDSPPDLRVARWDGALWRDHGNGALTGGMAAGTISTAWPINQFGPFTLASATLLNPLPVELLFFEAEPVGAKVRAAWATGAEADAKAFVVERSADGVAFEPVARLAAVGNSQGTTAYEAFDTAPLRGLSYYRLRMLDIDGDERFGPVRTVHREASATAVAYPNPADDQVWVDLDADAWLRAELFSLSGLALGELKPLSPEGRLRFDVRGLSSGAYVIRIETADAPPVSVRFMKRGSVQ